MTTSFPKGGDKMAYQAVRFKAGRKGWAVILKVFSPNGETTFVKRDLTKSQATLIKTQFNQELGYNE